MQAQRQPLRGIWLASPTILWLGLFFVVPLLLVLVVSFMTRAQDAGGTLPFTLEHYQRTLGVFSPILWRSLRIAALTTVICLILGYPLAFFISTRRSAVVRSFCLFLVILPFWTNFLIRTYAMRTLLANEGTINGILQNLGLLLQPLRLVDNQFGVLVGMVYGFLPFMVLPIFASVERFEFRFVDAAHDLGANDWRAFWRVVLPLTMPGVLAGSALVFIPSVGAYVTPVLMGGVRGLLIGNLIARQFGGSGNMPQGAAMSVVMMSMVLLLALLYWGLRRRGLAADG